VTHSCGADHNKIHSRNIARSSCLRSRFSVRLSVLDILFLARSFKFQTTPSRSSPGKHSSYNFRKGGWRAGDLPLRRDTAAPLEHRGSIGTPAHNLSLYAIRSTCKSSSNSGEPSRLQALQRWLNTTALYVFLGYPLINIEPFLLLQPRLEQMML
jgi:hypothetical protein